MVDRESLTAEDFQYDGSGVAWKARGCAFVGVTMALGSIGGVSTNPGALAILSVKYIIPGKLGAALYVRLTKISR
jgi:Uncharacterised protein family (UPF0220)